MKKKLFVKLIAVAGVVVLVLVSGGSILVAPPTL